MTAILEEEILTRAPVTPLSEQGADLASTAAQQSSTGEALKAVTSPCAPPRPSSTSATRPLAAGPGRPGTRCWPRGRTRGS
jgi:hypothetical protein